MIPEEDIQEATEELSRVFGIVKAGHLVTRYQDLFNKAHKLCCLPYKRGYLYSDMYILTDALKYQKENIQDKRSKAEQTSDELLKDVVKYLKDNLLADKYNASTSNTNPAQIAGTIANIVEYIDKKHSAVK